MSKCQEWNVRVIKTQCTFAEFIVEAKTKEEAEAKINLEKDVTDDHWNPDIQTDVFIQSDFTERMDKILPDLYYNPDERSE